MSPRLHHGLVVSADRFSPPWPRARGWGPRCRTRLRWRLKARRWRRSARISPALRRAAHVSARADDAGLAISRASRRGREFTPVVLTRAAPLVSACARAQNRGAVSALLPSRRVRLAIGMVLAALTAGLRAWASGSFARLEARIRAASPRVRCALRGPRLCCSDQLVSLVYPPARPRSGVAVPWRRSPGQRRWRPAFIYRPH